MKISPKALGFVATLFLVYGLYGMNFSDLSTQENYKSYVFFGIFIILLFTIIHQERKQKNE
ncbi:hypothetical protein GCM10009117_08110 [Gangjinia marincola]|uniref:Uncharacterized protein n=1 Tax=Gangjinia marincola TaxID=578463 RepID=A0ABP3XTI0_9FLAO